VRSRHSASKPIDARLDLLVQLLPLRVAPVAQRGQFGFGPGLGVEFGADQV
jgi:hypothetical protein